MTQQQLNTMQQQYKLSAIESDDIYTKDIIIGYLYKSQSTVAPKAFILGGQPGCGKTNLRNAIQDEIGEEGAVVINFDALRAEHPSFDNLQITNFQHAPSIVDLDATLWLGRLFEDAMEAKKNIVFDQTLGSSISVINTTMEKLKNAGYEVTVCMLAIPPLISQLQIYKRYEEQVKQNGMGRFVQKGKHDEVVDNTNTNIQAIQSDKIADTIRIYGRAYQPDETTTTIAIQLLPIYESQQINKQWINPLNPSTPLQTERNRPFYTGEKQYIKDLLANTVSLIEKRKGDVSIFSEEVNMPFITSVT